MASPVSRREFLITGLATAVIGTLGGCTETDEGGRSRSVTAAPIPEDQTPVGSDDRTELASPRIEFDASVISSFSDTSPGRLSLKLTNTSPYRLTANGDSRYVIPFLDDDYVAPNRTGDGTLFLAPDNARAIVDTEGTASRRLSAMLPGEPTDGCWTLPFEWPAAWEQARSHSHSVSLYPGKTRLHTYRLYFVDKCTVGQFTFVNSVVLLFSDSSGETHPHPTRLQFDLSVGETLEVQEVSVTPWSMASQ